MKILFDHPTPFAYAHGGFQFQIEQTKAALEKCGVEVEMLRWWDDAQRGDLVHFFGTPGNGYLSLAAAKKLPIIVTSLFTETCNRSDGQLTIQGWMVRLVLGFPAGGGIKQQLSWQTYGRATHNVVGLEAERLVLERVYRVPPDKISVVPLGLSESFLNAGNGRRNEDHLICTGTITARKCSVELAEMAHASQTPILFVGKPYHETDPCWLRFKRLIDGRLVKHHPHISSEIEMSALLSAARGFVLMSKFENWCLSAHEAAACGLPLLVQDQKWSRERFGDRVRYFKTIGNSAENANAMRQFYEETPNLTAPAIKLYSWLEVAGKLKSIYEELLKR